jgi:hypothetical protein
MSQGRRNFLQLFRHIFREIPDGNGRIRAGAEVLQSWKRRREKKVAQRASSNHRDFEETWNKQGLPNAT